MNRVLKWLIAFVLIMGVLLPNSASVDATSKKYSATVKVKVLNVREKASTKSTKVGTLKKGAKVTVYSKTKSGWSQIKYKNKKAYVSTKHLEFAPSTKKVSYSQNKKKIYVYRNDNAGILITHKYNGSKNGWSVWNTYYEKEKIWQYKEKEDNKGLYKNGNKKTYTLLHYPLNSGKTWTTKMNDETYITKVTSVNKTVKTEAGTFKKVIELTIKNKRNTYLEKAYYAPNIGLIKSSYDDKEYGSNETVLVKLKSK